MKARTLVAALALSALSTLFGAAGCARAPDGTVDPLAGAQPVRGDVAFYLVAEDGAADARTLPVLRPFPGQEPRVALKPMPAIARGQIAQVALSTDENGQASLDLRLNEEGARRLAQITRDNLGKRMAVVVGATAVSVATIQGEIPGGRLRIGGLAQGDAQALHRELTVAK
ncbi:hypothetical protein GLE_2012 [Lysobacter enzymogenes]|uniref:SecDF P1 head subdomain domain-containing protein n=1 Tax=Lysobacter enzymogenes TaxID=69 RepID=A0A0S2DFS7_LYSEN|nr:hypothetical protein GLE_2012 [Lysobacter enzymogenes]